MIKKIKIITINLPDQYLDIIQKFIDDKIVSSRSKFVRSALKEFLPKEMDFYKEITGDHN